MSSLRLVAVVGPLTGELRTRHYVGLPGGQQESLPYPTFVVLEASDEGVFLFRFSADGTFGGDTWHESVEEAKEQADFEYAPSLGPWREVRVNAIDPVAFARDSGMVSRHEA